MTRTADLRMRPQTASRLLPALLVLFAWTVQAQDFSTSRDVPAATAKPMEQAVAALEAHDFEQAIRLLTPLAEADPKNARIAYNLASAQDALDQTSAAERRYRAAIADEGGFAEAHVALGLLLARNGRTADARAELAEGTALPTCGDPLKARALRALARIDQRTRPGDARNELMAALKLSPETPDDTLLGAELAATATNGASAAESAYRRVLAAQPNDPAATAELAHLLVTQSRAGEAETLLRTALAAHPADAALTTQLTSVYAGEDKLAEAIALAEGLHATEPRDANVSHLLAELLLQTSDYAHAEPLLAALAVQNPKDTAVVDERARALIHLKRFADAEGILARVVAQPALFPTPLDLGEAAGDLAFAASANHEPEVALQALEVRAKVLPPSPPVLFLTAISHDSLHHVSLAVQAYKQFLEASKGLNADEEFEARHRLIALEHTR